MLWEGNRNRAREDWSSDWIIQRLLNARRSWGIRLVPLTSPMVKINPNFSPLIQKSTQ